MGQHYAGTTPIYSSLRMKPYKEKKSKYVWWFSYVIIKKECVEIDESNPDTFDIYIYCMCSNDKFKNESIEALNEKMYQLILKRISSSISKILKEYYI